MNFSISAGASASAGSVVANASIIDNSWGCVHSNYQTKAKIISPSGRAVTGQSSGLMASTSLPINGEFGSYTIVVTLNYNCSCLGPSAISSGQTIQVKKPKYVDSYNEGYVGGNPGCAVGAPRYWLIRDYQVQDKNHQPLARVMSLNEYLTTTLNTCGVVGTVQGGTLTTPGGTFADWLYMCGPVPACEGGGSCAITKQQTVSADGNLLQPTLTMAYGCNGVTVIP